MAIITSGSGATSIARPAPKTNVGFWEGQKLAKQKVYEKKSRKKKIKLEPLAIFTQQLSAMLDAGLPLVTALDALQEQTEDPILAIIIRDVRADVSGGTAFSDATRKFPNAFPNLFVAMVEAGEASGSLSSILGKVATYFEDSVKLVKKVKGAMTYPAVVISFAVALVNVLLIFVIPVFREMFSSFGAELPKPTQLLLGLSDFLKGNIHWIILGLIVFIKVMLSAARKPKGRIIKDRIFHHLPLVGNLVQKIALSRFCRTYSILLRSGVPILRALEIVSRASGNTYIEAAALDISRHISQGGQLSESVAANPFFPPTIKHLARAGEQTGDVGGMMNKVADFYDVEIQNTVESLTSLMEPLMIAFLGVIIGGIVIAMFLPILNMATVVNF